LSDTEPQAEPTARVFAFVDENDAATERIVADLIESHGWARWPAPELDFQVIQFDTPIDASEQVSKKAGEVHADLSAAGLEPAALAAHLIAPTGSFDPSGGLHIQNLASTPSPDELARLLQVIVPGSGAPSSDGGTPSGNGTPPKPPDSGTGAGKAAVKSDAAEAEVKPAADPAATITATIPAFPDPSALWPDVRNADRGALAKEVVANLYRDRSAFARRSEWVTAPELVLLDACAADKREGLAEELLRARAQLTDADAKTRESRAGLEEQQVKLAEKRVALAAKGVELAGEMFEQMKKWRSIANWGLGFLVATTIFSMAAAGYVLLKLMPAKEISDVAAPIIIFVLALFAISPAVLLLRERPLEGLDKWSPGGSGNDDEAGSATGGSTESGSGDSATTQPAAEASQPA
jgi:hypothetical protein